MYIRVLYVAWPQCFCLIGARRRVCDLFRVILHIHTLQGIILVLIICYLLFGHYLWNTQPTYSYPYVLLIDRLHLIQVCWGSIYPSRLLLQYYDGIAALLPEFFFFFCSSFHLTSSR